MIETGGDYVDSGRLTIVLSAFALLLLVGLVLSTVTFTKVQKLQPQVVLKTVTVVATPTVEPTATPAALLRLPIVPSKKVVK